MRISGIFAAFWVLTVVSAGASASENWSLEQGPDDAGCHLLAPRQEIETGYNQAKVEILVDETAVTIKTGAKLDGGFDDLGVSVDGGLLTAIDRIEKERAAVLQGSYAELVEQFKRGTKVRVQLRFWPTWPATGTYSAEFSLIGFTKAYGALSDCKA
jgi:hypothetical protein